MLQRPFVRIVTELTLDGKITLGNKKSSRGLFTFQSPDLKLFTHQQRAQFDGILVGAETIRTDNPLLTIRGVKAKKITRIILTKSCLFPSHPNIFDGSVPTVIVVPKSVNQKKVEQLKKYPINVILCGEKLVDFNELMMHLDQLNIKKLLVEGGRHIVEQFLANNLVDEFLIKYIPIFVGGNKTPHLLREKNDLKNQKLIKWKLKQLNLIGGHAVSLYER